MKVKFFGFCCANLRRSRYLYTFSLAVLIVFRPRIMDGRIWYHPSSLIPKSTLAIVKNESTSPVMCKRTTAVKWWFDVNIINVVRFLFLYPREYYDFRWLVCHPYNILQSLCHIGKQKTSSLNLKFRILPFDDIGLNPRLDVIRLAICTAIFLIL